MTKASKHAAKGVTGWTPPNLSGKVAVVAGASRGAGRGIAVALGHTGATVYVAGRTASGGPPPFDGAPGTIEDTAEEITRRGGRGIAVRADCSVEADVAALFARVEKEHGHLDLLANGVWGSSEQNNLQFFGKGKRAFWELESPPGWSESVMQGAYPCLLTSVYGARLMAPRRKGLIVHITDHNDDDAGSSLFWLFYTLGHRAINRMAPAMHKELAKRNVAVIALCPGFMRTERVMMFVDKMSEAEKKKWGFDKSETTEYVGRAVASLAADPKVLKKSGKLLYGGDLAGEYGFKDADGKDVGNFLKKMGMA